MRPVGLPAEPRLSTELTTETTSVSPVTPVIPADRATRFGVGVLVFALLAANARAAEVETPGVSGSAIVQMLIGLALIIGVLFVAAYLVRKLNGGPRFGQAGRCASPGGLAIGARERIVVVEVGETWLVVGVVPGQIKTLHTLARGELLRYRRRCAVHQWLRQMTERAMSERHNTRWLKLLAVLLLCLPLFAWAQAGGARLPALTSTPTPAVGQTYTLSIQTLLTLTALTFIPAALLMMTGFTRIIIVLSCCGTRSARERRRPTWRCWSGWRSS